MRLKISKIDGLISVLFLILKTAALGWAWASMIKFSGLNTKEIQEVFRGRSPGEVVFSASQIFGICVALGLGGYSYYFYQKQYAHREAMEEVQAIIWAVSLGAILLGSYRLSLHSAIITTAISLLGGLLGYFFLSISKRHSRGKITSGNE